MDAGRDIVVQIAEAVAGEVLVTVARARREAACQIVNGVKVSVWPIGARFRQDTEGPVALVDGLTSLGPLDGYVVPLADGLGPVRAALFEGLAPLAEQLNSEVWDVDFKVIDGGTVVAGIDFWGGVFPDDGAWAAFGDDFREQNDWGLFVDSRLIVPFIQRAARGAASALPFVLEEVEVDWGDPIVVRLKGVAPLPITVLTTLEDDVVIEVELDFAINPARELILRRRGATANVHGPFAQLIGWIAGDDIRQGLDDNTDPRDFFDPVSLRFRLPDGALMTGTEVRLREDGLVILGEMSVPRRPQPRLAYSPARPTFYEDPATACGAGPPRFESQTIYLRNTGVSPLFLCDVEVEGTGFAITGTGDGDVSITDDGTALRYVGRGLGNNEAFELMVSYTGSRGQDGVGSLRVTSNDPEHLVQDIALRAPQEGILAWTTDPEAALYVRVANTRPGRDHRAVRDCREVVVKTDPARIQRPAGEVAVINTCDVAVVLCGIFMPSPDGALVVDEPSTRRIEPGDGITLGIRFYPTTVRETSEGVLELFEQTGKVRRIEVTARLDPEAQRRRADLSVTGDLLDVVFDLANDALCIPHDAHVCRAGGAFEPVGPGELAIGVITAGPVDPEVRVRFLDDGGAPVVDDVSGRRRRGFSVGWIDGDGFAGNPCIAQFDGMPAHALPGIRVRLGGLRLARIGEWPEGDVRAVTAGPGYVAIATERGVHLVDWVDPATPREMSRLDLAGVTDLGTDGRFLVVGAPSSIALVDVSDPPTPRIILQDTRADVTAATLAAGRLYTCHGDRVVERTFAGRSDHPGNQTPGEVQLPVPVRQVGATTHGVFAAGERHAFLLDRGGVAATYEFEHRIQRIAASARSVAVTTAAGTDVLRVARDGLHLITRFARPHWSAAFTAGDGRDRLVRLGEDGGLELWRGTTRRLRREDFADAFRVHWKG